MLACVRVKANECNIQIPQGSALAPKGFCYDRRSLQECSFRPFCHLPPEKGAARDEKEVLR